MASMGPKDDREDGDLPRGFFRMHVVSNTPGKENQDREIPEPGDEDA